MSIHDIKTPILDLPEGFDVLDGNAKPDKVKLKQLIENVKELNVKVNTIMGIMTDPRYHII